MLGKLRKPNIIRLSVPVTLPDQPTRELTFFALSVKGSMSLNDGDVEFSAEQGNVVYLATDQANAFDSPPTGEIIRLTPGVDHRITMSYTLDGGNASLWIIEYDRTDRLCHQTVRLRHDRTELSWITHADNSSGRLAIRLTGTGRLRVDGIEISETGSLRSEGVASPLATSRRSEAGVERSLSADPGGEFRRYSIFRDPCGDRAYTPRHHRFYETREPEWYSGIAERFKDCRDVLDIGCGPGLLIQALQSAGVHRVIGLARDAHYLADCERRGIEVIAHDLNLPFPFLESHSFDGVVIHHTLDYLAPIAIRTVLRECHRVLTPGGLLVIRARSDGRNSGDLTRTIDLKPGLMNQLLDEAGFSEAQISIEGNSIHVEARCERPFTNWPVKKVKLGTGHSVHPFSQPVHVLAEDAEAWDQLSRRDMTLLTTPTKDEVRVEAQLVAYFTGYRETEHDVQRAICRAVSDDGLQWRREPLMPVLSMGLSQEVDATGIAAGSVIQIREGDSVSYRMYYSPRDAEGHWPGIGVARSTDGIHWKKESGLVLKTSDFASLRHLALADVIRTSQGRWLMHCEGWIENRGWSIFQAESVDGLVWRPTQPEPVIDAATIPWAGAHVANPKCLELEPGRFVLGFNAADESKRFQLGLAESEDGRRWREVEVNPVACPVGDSFRIESCFMTREAWNRGDRRMYFFHATTGQTERSSDIMLARADETSNWIGGDWTTTHPGRFRVRDDRLIVETGEAEASQALSRSVAIDGETQITAALQITGGDGQVRLLLRNADRTHVLTLRCDGTVSENEFLCRPPRSKAGTLSVVLRIHHTWTPAPELSFQVWLDGQPNERRQTVLPFGPSEIRIEVSPPSCGDPMVIDHLNAWKPACIAIESEGDAPRHQGDDRVGDFLKPMVGKGAHQDQLENQEIDSNVSESIRQFQINQLELMWQTGRLDGLNIDMRRDGTPPLEVLQWLESRQSPSKWHVATMAHLEWLRTNVLDPFGFPVLLSLLAGESEHERTSDEIVSFVQHSPHLYVMTNCFTSVEHLQQAIRLNPHHVLFDSELSVMDQTETRRTILDLDVPDTSKTLVLSENRRFITERGQWHRWRALMDGGDLLFPPIPQTPEEMVEQGFEIIPPEDLPARENDEAKAYWSEYDIKSWYEQDKPWAHVIADLVRTLKPRSVLEFGCNVGRNLQAIHQACPEVQLVGLDVNEEAVRIGHERTGLDLRTGDEATLRRFHEGEFDLVFTVSVLDHIADVQPVCEALVHCATKHLYCLEVTLPVEGKVTRHFDHAQGEIRPSTEASYSWHLNEHLGGLQRVQRLDARPCYLHAASLGPYYWSYLAHLETPEP